MARSSHRRGRRLRFIHSAGALVASAAVAGVQRPVTAQEQPAPAPPAGAQRIAAPADAPASRFDIPPGPLGEVIVAFQRVTGITATLAVNGAAAIHSNGVSGVLTHADALAALLAGTGLAPRMVSSTEVIVEFPPLRQSVDVVGRATVLQSPKYAVPLRDIPQTVEVIPRTAMEQQAVTSVSEALRNVPGITLQAGEGGGASSTAGDMFNMRGFNASNSLFVDGVRDDGLLARDVFNLEQVEVFMGPTGSDVGRGTAAGYVNLQTKTPHLERAVSAVASVGIAAQRRVAVDVNQPLSLRAADGWLARSAVRLNAVVQDSGVPGRDEVALNTKALAPSIAIGIGTRTRVAAGGQVVRQNNLPDYGIPGAAWLDEPLTPTTVRAPRPVDQSNYYGSPTVDYDHGSQRSITGRVERDLTSTMTLRNQARYNRSHREAVITAVQNVASYDPATNTVALARQGNDRENEIFSNQTSLSSRFSTRRLRHTSSIGVEYARESQFAPTLSGVGTRAPVDIFNPNPNDPVAGFAPARTGASTGGSTDTLALYGFDTVDLGSRWQVSGGLRWEHYDTAFRAADASGAITTDEHAAGGLLSGKAGLVLRVSSSANAYLAYGTSLTPPGTANFTLSAQPNNQNNPNVDPQHSTNYEAGAKWELAGGRLALNAAVFRTLNENVIFTVDASAVPPIYNQDDGQRVNGVTLGASGHLTERWDLLASFGYLDTALRSQSAATTGKRLTLTPKRSGSVWTTYRLPAGFTFGGGIRAADEVFVNAANTIATPGYHLADALVEYEVNTHLSLRLNVSNVTGETYIRNVNNNGGRYNPGNPRAALLTSKLGF